MTLKAPTFANPEVIEMFVAPTSGAPATDKLVICTGIAILDPPFGSNIDEIRRDTLVFTIPAEHAEDVFLTVSFYGQSGELLLD